MKMNSAIVLASLCVASSAQAAAFLLSNHGARSSGRGNAYAATVEDPSAIWHNPAGITQLDGIQVYVGANLIKPTSFYRPEGGGDEVSTESPIAISPNLYVTGRLSDLLTVGLGVNPPYGSTVRWGDDSPGLTVVREQVLRTWFITPTVGVDLRTVGVPGLSFAAGPDLVPASAYLERDIHFGEARGRVRLSGEDFGVGFRAGALYKPEMVPGLSVAAYYRHPVKFAFEGKANFDMEDPYRARLPEDGDGAVDLGVPRQVIVGVAYRVNPMIQLEVNGVHTGWSIYDELPITLPNDTVSVSARDYEDTLGVRSGVEVTPMDMLSVRAGFEFDPTPVPASTLDFTLPDVDRRVVTLGVGVDLPADVHVDLAGWYLIPNDRKTGTEPNAPLFKGTYEVNAFTVALSVGVAFGKGEAAPSMSDAPMTSEQSVEAAPAATTPTPEQPAAATQDAPPGA